LENLSTRAQIEFIVKYGNQEIKRRIYQHSDGYPEGVLSGLKKFFAWLTSEPEARDPADADYTSANYIYYSKKKLESYKNGVEKIGFGISDINDPLHGDLAYFYEVIMTQLNPEAFRPTTEINVNVYKCSRGEKTFIKKINLDNFTKWEI
jgi:hypothetical protein